MNYLEIHVPKEYENPVRRLTLTSDRGEQIYIAPFTVASNTAIEQEIEYLKVYPNPTDQILNVVVTDAVDGRAEVYTMDGTFLLSTELIFGSAIIDVSSLTPGVYMVKSTNEAGVVHVVQFIINR